MAEPAEVTTVSTSPGSTPAGGETFCVDVDRLGEIPAVVERARASLAGVTVTAAGADAGRAAPAAMIDRLVASLERFVAAASSALDGDIAKLQASRRNYAACELGAATAGRQLGDRILAGWRP